MTEAITIRRASAADRARVLRLAELDSGRAPEGELLLAESGGRLRAAVAVGDGRAVADPFAATADVVEVLRGLAARERGGRHAAGRASWLARLAPAWRDAARQA